MQEEEASAADELDSMFTSKIEFTEPKDGNNGVLKITKAEIKDLIYDKEETNQDTGKPYTFGEKIAFLSNNIEKAVEKVAPSIIKNYATHSRHYLTVTDFGALGDGNTDDTSAIKSCIINARLAGQDVYFPKGQYKVSELDAKTGNIKFFGTGDATLIFTPAKDDFLFTGTESNVTHVTFENLNFIISNEDSTNNTGFIKFVDGSDIVIEDCRFENQKGTSVYLDKIVEGTIKNNTFTHKGQGGSNIIKLNGCQDLHISENSFTDKNYSFGAASGSADDMRNVVSAASISLAAIGATDTSLINKEIFIENNYFNKIELGIRFSGSENIKVNHNIFDNCYSGVFLNFNLDPDITGEDIISKNCMINNNIINYAYFGVCTESNLIDSFNSKNKIATQLDKIENIIISNNRFNFFGESKQGMVDVDPLNGTVPTTMQAHGIKATGKIFIIDGNSFINNGAKAIHTFIPENSDLRYEGTEIVGSNFRKQNSDSKIEIFTLF